MIAISGIEAFLYVVVLTTAIALFRFLKRIRDSHGGEMVQFYRKWLELDIIEREKREAAMTDEERKELKASEIAYYDQQKKF